jgi:hypothetical protein
MSEITISQDERAFWKWFQENRGTLPDPHREETSWSGQADLLKLAFIAGYSEGHDDGWGEGHSLGAANA